MTVHPHDLTENEALDIYFKMVLTRMTEDRHEELYREQVIPVYVHKGMGQEAVGCGVSALLGPGDYLIGTHRGVAEFVGKGMSVRDIFLEYGGRSGSISGGWAGLHLHSPELNILPLLGGLGTDFSLGAGAGLSIRNRGLDSVVVEYFGEGASEQADFHGAMNMAMIYRLPVLFCCCTNQYVELHPYRDTTCVADIASRAKGYGMEWKIVADGNDMFSVGRAMKEAIAYARGGKGPYFLEFKTYRIAGHHTGDQALYRDPEEVEEAGKNDPIIRARELLAERGWAGKEALDRISAECRRMIDEGVQALEESELPEPDPLMNHGMGN